MKTLNVLLVALVVCFAITTATQAELTDLTGKTYNAVFYNNNHTGSPAGSNTAPAANTTDLTYDTDFSTTQIYSGQVGLGTLTGTLVDFGGGATTVTLELDHGGSQLFAVSSSDPFTIGDPGHTVFDDVVGSAATDGSNWLNGGTLFQRIIFSGLKTDGTLYDFVGTANDDSHSQVTGTDDGLSVYGTGSVVNADGDSGTEAGVSLATNGTGTPIAGSAHLASGATGDILRWDDIDPGADGIIEIRFDSITVSHNQAITPAIEMFALGEVGAGGGGIPEPSSFVLGILGLLGFSMFGRRRNR